MKSTLMVMAIMLLLVFPMVTHAQVCDGKILSFPSKHNIQAVDLSKIEFNFEGIPANQRFMVGRVYFTQFKSVRSGGVGAVEYLFLTKWEPEKMEFFVSINSRSAESPQYYMDCSLTDTTDYQCTRRGRTAGNNWRLRFRGQNITLMSSDGWDGELELAGTVPIRD